MATNVVFYANNGLLSGNKAPDVQRTMDILNDLFSRVGLEMNAKRQWLWQAGGRKTLLFHQWLTCRRWQVLDSPANLELGAKPIECALCGTSVKWRNLDWHHKSKKYQQRVKEATRNSAATELHDKSQLELELPMRPPDIYILLEVVISLPSDVWQAAHWKATLPNSRLQTLCKNTSDGGIWWILWSSKRKDYYHSVASSNATSVYYTKKLRSANGLWSFKQIEP